MVNPGAVLSVLLMKLMLKLRELKPDAELGLLGEVEVPLRADDNESATSVVPVAKVQP